MFYKDISEIIEAVVQIFFGVLFGFYLGVNLCCVSALEAFWGSSSSEAMLVEANRNMQPQGQLVQVLGGTDAPLILANEGQRLCEDWQNLGSAFLESLSGGERSRFEMLRSSGNLHPLCQFVAESFLLCILDNVSGSSSVDLARLEDCCRFFRNPMCFMKLMRTASFNEERVDGKKLINFMWASMGGPFLGDVRDSIQSAWFGYMGAYIKRLEAKQQKELETFMVAQDLEQEKMKTLIKEEKRKQDEVDLNRQLKKSEAFFRIENQRLEVLERRQRLVSNQMKIEENEVRLHYMQENPTTYMLAEKAPEMLGKTAEGIVRGFSHK